MADGGEAGCTAQSVPARFAFAPKRLPPLAVTVCLLACVGCASHGTTPAKRQSGLSAAALVKTDIDRVAEAHQREVFANLRLLAEKLYRRNPRELQKSAPDVKTALARIFDRPHRWHFSELEGKRGIPAIHLAFDSSFRGDRVLAFVAGLGGMIQAAFQDKTELFVLDDLDPQSLYNAARNVEIAVWKLSNARTPRAELYLLSNDAAGPVANLSFEREFGKVIGSLDVLSKIIADKTDRTVVKMIHSVATAVFLPIK